MSKSLNIMLVHGAWADATCWSKVILRLLVKGYNVSAVQIPLTSLGEDIAVARRMLASREGPTVLVGHSYGGAVITGAAVGQPNVGALVYITAFGLDEGESVDSMLKQYPASSGAAAIAPDDNGYLWLDRAKFHASFAGGATNDEAAVMAIVQRPLSLTSFTDKEGPAAWKDKPSWYLVCTEDNIIPPAAQEFMAKRMKANVSHVASGHCPFMSEPDAVVDTIVLAANSLS